MPFTPAHPAAVLPLLRRGRWVSAALVTGSIAPDLPTYLPLGLTHDLTHPLSALLWPDTVIALGALLAWWGPIRPAVLSLWPAVSRHCGPAAWHDPALRRSTTGAASWLFWVLLSSVVGVATHLLWDGFTHGDGFFVRHLSPLRGAFAGHAIYTLLQIVCSVIGIAIVTIYLAVQWRRAPSRAEMEQIDQIGQSAERAAVPTRLPEVVPWVRVAVVLVIVIGTVFTALWTGHHIPQPFAWHRHWLWRHRLVNAGGVLLALLAAWSLLLALWPTRESTT